MENVEKEMLVFVKKINEEDIDAVDYKFYKRLQYKARLMKFSRNLESWYITFRNQELEFFDFEIIVLDPYLKNPAKVTVDELSLLTMLFPGYNWEKAFLKNMRVGW